MVRVALPADVVVLRSTTTTMATSSSATIATTTVLGSLETDVRNAWLCSVEMESVVGVLGKITSVVKSWGRLFPVAAYG